MDKNPNLGQKSKFAAKIQIWGKIPLLRKNPNVEQKSKFSANNEISIIFRKIFPFWSSSINYYQELCPLMTAIT